MKPVKHNCIWQWHPKVAKWKCRLCENTKDKLSRGDGGRIDLTHRSTLELFDDIVRGEH